MGNKRDALVPQALVGEITAASFQSLGADIVADRCAGSSAKNFVKVPGGKSGRAGDAFYRQGWIAQMTNDVKAGAGKMVCAQRPASRRWARFVRDLVRSNYPKCSISNSVRTRTFRAGWCPGGRTIKIPASAGGQLFISATRAPDASSFSVKKSGSAAMPSPATAAAARATPLSALNRPCGCTAIVLSPSMNCQVSVPCTRH